MSYLRLLALLATALLQAVATAAPVLNERCPVEPSELAVERYQTTYRGSAVSFCCPDCVIEFEQSPEKFLGELTQMIFAEPSPERSALQQKVDAVWNAGVRTPGLSLGVIALLALLIGRFVSGKTSPGSRCAQLFKSATGLRGLATLLTVALGAEAFSAHRAHRKTLHEVNEADLANSIHYTVYQEYGDPPMPSRPDRPPAVSTVFYRGNDERNPALFNGGYYRTTTFHLDLCDADGKAIGHGDRCDPAQLFFRVRFDRAPGTPDYFWTPERMALMYATRDPGKFHGRFAPHEDSVAMRETEPMQSWEFRYPLAGFIRIEPVESLRGIFYQCEQRFGDDDQTVIGGRFHYAFQFDLRFSDGKLGTDSDIWMGALYRKRSLRIWEIPEREWLSIEPIPVIEGEQGTTDPKLLGIEGYEKDTN